MASEMPARPGPAPHEFRASHAHHPRGLALGSRVYVNRNLRMRNLGAVGFDLDYTLAHYRYREIEDLAFRITQRKLVEKRGHPEEILEIPFDPEFVVRGLVIDRRRGNILKMDYHNYVVRAFHGRRPLSAEQRKKTYRSRRVRTSADAYISVDTLFHMPEVYLYLALVDHYEERGRKPDYPALYQDVRDMIDEAHADGSIKQEIQKSPGRFVTRDPLLPECLDTLRASGKKVFLLTNSEPYYTDVLLSHLLEAGGRHWRTFFDLVYVDARKPRFFREKGAAETVEPAGPGAPIVSGGDVWKLEEQLGFSGDHILYWGDHTYGDILRSKKSVGWRTAMIIPEVETEMLVNASMETDLLRLDQTAGERDRTGHEHQMARAELHRLEELLERSRGSADEVRRQLARKVASLRDRCAGLEKERARLHDEVVRLDEECSAAHNKHWGMVFREANEITRFAHQVKDFACIYTARVSNFLNYPSDTYFRAPVDRMPHEL